MPCILGPLPQGALRAKPRRALRFQPVSVVRRSFIELTAQGAGLPLVLKLAVQIGHHHQQAVDLLLLLEELVTQALQGVLGVQGLELQGLQPAVGAVDRIVHAAIGTEAPGTAEAVRGRCPGSIGALMTAIAPLQTTAQPGVLWLTGLSGAGKSTIAEATVAALRARGAAVTLLDGDALRAGLNRNLGFSAADRDENIRRAAEVARLFVAAGVHVVVAMISPLRRQREEARTILAGSRFSEVFVDTPLAVAEARDPKGLYKRARAGLLPEFTGISSPYEPPLAPDVRIVTTETPAAEAAEALVTRLLTPT